MDGFYALAFDEGWDNKRYHNFSVSFGVYRSFVCFRQVVDRRTIGRNIVRDVGQKVVNYGMNFAGLGSSGKE